MSSPSAALQFLLLTFSGWANRRQQDVICYLQEENRILREQLGGRRLCLPAKGKALGRKALCQVAGIVSPDTILRWYRQLITQKYDGSANRGPGRLRIDDTIRSLVLRWFNVTRLPCAAWAAQQLRNATPLGRRASLLDPG